MNNPSRPTPTALKICLLAGGVILLPFAAYVAFVAAVGWALSGLTW